VTLDGAGNLYIADGDNNRIRRVDPAGIITTIAGTGAKGFAGDNGPATRAQLSNVGGVAVDAAGNIYIADSSNGRVRRIDTKGIITTVAGTGVLGDAGNNRPATEAGLQYPGGVTVDGAGNLYIVDQNGNRIRVVRRSEPG
jgi:sugar lactone lactonase YvrE